MLRSRPLLKNYNNEKPKTSLVKLLEILDEGLLKGSTVAIRAAEEFKPPPHTSTAVE